MRHHVELTRVGPLHTAVIRDRIPARELSRFVPAACGEVWTFIRKPGLPKPGRNLALYLDRAGSVECGVEVSSPFTGNDRVISSHTPGGLVATTTHFGPYISLVETHRAIETWCSAQGHQMSGASWELYGHWQEEWTSDPSKIRTDVYHLIRPNER